MFQTANYGNLRDICNLFTNFKGRKPFKVFKVVKVIKVVKKLNLIFIVSLQKPTPMQESLIPQRGNYRQLLSYQKADVIFQITYYFCSTFLAKGDRTVDQMIQAARSGKQNIIEGCAASATSAKTEIKLINVAKASLQELLEDYEDFLKTRQCDKWQKGSREFEAMRNLGRTHNDAAFFMNLVATRPPETIANMAIVLINQADYLLFRQLQKISEKFLTEGGFTERMHRMRLNSRDNKTRRE